MELVVDTSCLIAALIRPAKSREIICSLKFVLYAPEHILSESLHHKKDIIEKAAISDGAFDELMSILLTNINIVPENEFRRCRDEALRLSRHQEDTLFLALALAKKIPIWSNDKDLKQQPIVRVLTTSELVESL